MPGSRAIFDVGRGMLQHLDDLEDPIDLLRDVTRGAKGVVVGKNIATDPDDGQADDPKDSP